MDREMTVRGLVSLLKGEIAERQAMIAALEARLGPAAPTSAPRQGSAASVAIEILRETGRPMHGLDEIIPALEARGVTIKSRAGFATLLIRTGKVVRTAPGTFGLASDVAAP